MHRRIWISLLVVLGVVIGSLLAASPIAEARARSEAKERGLILQMGDFSLGWFRAELSDVTLALDGVSEIQVSIDSVLVDFSLGQPRLRQVVAQGGRVSINGSLDDVRASLERWRAARPASQPEKAKDSPPRRTDVVRDFEIVWTGALGGKRKQSISGLVAERGPKGLHVGADLVELGTGEFETQIAGVEIRIFEPSLEISKAAKLGASEMRITYSAPTTPEGDPSTNKAKPDAADLPPVDDDGNLKSAPGSATSGLGSRLQQDSGRVALVKHGLRLLREELEPRLPPETLVDKVWVTYRRGDERLHVGPSSLSMKKSKSEFVIAVVPRGATKGTPLSLQLAVKSAQAKDAATVSVKGGPIALSTLGVAEGSFGLSGVEHTHVSGSASASLTQDGRIVEGGGEAFIDGLALDSSGLATSVVAFPKLAFSGHGRMHIDGSYYRLKSATLRMGQTSFQGEFEMERGEDYVSLKANAKAPLVSCQALVDSAPRGLLGPAETMRFDGTFSLEAGVEADTRELSNMKARWDFKNGCRVTAVPAELDPQQFRGMFRREVVGPGNYPMQVEFGPLTSNWAHWNEVSPYVEKALLVTEDGRFYRHDGFDDRAIESAIRDNVTQGRFVRGASTISMQLAKNLYLSRTKTLSRKFQEAALTSLLEQNFEKQELLELYVNVIEFGPGVYGIRAAAEHYFSTVPGRLSPAQAFFLASVLPAPTQNHFEVDGTLRESRRNYVHRLLRISHQRDALTDEELEAALEEELVFGQADTRPEERTSEQDPTSEPRSTETPFPRQNEQRKEGPRSLEAPRSEPKPQKESIKKREGP